MPSSREPALGMRRRMPEEDSGFMMGECEEGEGGNECGKSRRGENVLNYSSGVASWPARLGWDGGMAEMR